MRRGIITSSAVVLIAMGLAGKAALAGTIADVSDGEQLLSDVTSPNLTFDWVSAPTIDTLTGDVLSGQVHIYHTATQSANYTYDLSITFDNANATGSITVTGPRNSDSQVVTYTSTNLSAFDLPYYNLTAPDGAAVEDATGVYRVAFLADNGDRIVTNAFEHYYGAVADTWIVPAAPVPAPAAATGGIALLGLAALGKKRSKRHQIA